MKKLLQHLIALIVTKPAATLYGLNSILAPVLLFAFGADKAWVGGVSTVIAGLAVVVTGLTTRPPAVPVILGGATAILNASVAFGAHLNPSTTATILAGLNLLLAFGFHMALTPKLSTYPAPLQHVPPQQAAPTAHEL